MRTEDEIRREVERLEAKAESLRKRGRAEASADYDSDAAMLRWALGEEKG